MEFFRIKQDIDFLRHRRWAYGFSTLISLIALVSIFTQGFKLGLDFTGGVLLEVGYQQSADLDQVRKALEGAGQAEAVVQHVVDR